jgi:ADP-heptose:LPS heptosyltransferase
MIHLPTVTLLAIDCYNYGAATAALKKSIEQCKFASVKLLTDIDLELDGIEVVQIPTIKSKEQYSLFVIKELYKYFDTDYVLIIQHDGYVLDGKVWKDEFLEYDYIGAPWLYTDGRNVGNGGFSLRSKLLQHALATDKKIEIVSPEDEIIGRMYRYYLEENYAIKFAPQELAESFSFELREPNQKTFGFHSYFHHPYRPTVIIKRTAALGDVLLTEPVAKYYFTKGYNVVLDIPSNMFEMFTNHYFPVKHISQFDKGRITPEKIVNLDLAYEVKPRQNRLKSYFEFCGIKDYKLSRPILFPLVNEQTKLFKKYAVIHIDNKNMPHRNIFNVDWKAVKKHLEAYGYVVIQVGHEEHESIGIEINTPSIGFLKFVIAGCDLFLGIDSGPLNIAMAYNKPCVGFFGSVNPKYVHPDMEGLEIIQQPCIYQHCYHNQISVTGVECIFDVKKPPCCIAETDQVIDAINNLHKPIKKENEINA